MSRVIVVCFLPFLALVGLSTAQNAPEPLSSGQRTAVREALRKLFNYAFQNWHDEDSRWEALEAAEETHQESDGSAHLNLEQPEEVDMITEPRDRRLSSKVANNVLINKSKWVGDKWKGLADPVGCWALAADLLHEGDHQDDDYAWPPVTAEDKERYYCAERDASAKEVEVLADAKDELTDAQGLELEPEIARARAQYTMWVVKKENL